jgi:hypothetical protein
MLKLLLPDPDQVSCTDITILEDQRAIELQLIARQTRSACPVCQAESDKVCMNVSCVVSSMSLSRTTTIHDRIRVLISWFPTVSMNLILHCQTKPKGQLFLSRFFVGFTVAIHTQR